jgi:flagellar biosynthesis protein FlhF
MRIKSFFANTIEEAIRQARHELGPEAMLVNSKRTGVEAQHLGAYEVVVCGDAPEYGREDPETKQDAGRSAPTALPVDQLSRDVSELKQQMEKLALTLARSGSGMASIAFDAELSRAFTRLTDAELDTELAYDVVSRISSPLSPAMLRAELAKLTHVDKELGYPGSSSRVVALVGPPGSGKTSALVKLAVQYGVTAHRPVQILTTDTYRIAAAEELRCYAAILGIAFQVLETPAALAHALRDCCHTDACRHKDLILIDTPGLSRNEMDISKDWADVLAANPSIDTHLVLPASMRTADLKRVATQYDVFRPRKLLFTRLDETQTLGPILSLSIRMEKPISFFSSGQRIPEDLQPAAVGTLLDSILGESTEQALQTKSKSEPASQPKSKPKYGVVAA